MSHDPITTTHQTAPRRRLPAISSRARVLAASGIAGAMLVAGSFALFSDTGAVRTTFTAGTLDLKLDDGQDGNPTPHVVEFDGADVLAPGVSVARELVVFNSGSVAADLAMAAPVVTNPATGAELLQDDLALTIVDTGTSTTLYAGPLTAATFTGFDLGADQTTATGHTLEFTVTVDAGASVAVAGQSVQVDFPFTATQQP